MIAAKQGRRRASRTVTALIAVAATAVAASGGVAAAAGPLDQSQTALDSTHSYYSLSSGLFTQTFAQTFTAGRTGLLDQVSLPLRSRGPDLTVEVVPVTAGGAPDTTAAPLASAVVPSSAAPPFGVTWVPVTLPDTMVTAGSQYAIALVAPAFGAWQWLGASSPLYADGQAYYQAPDSSSPWNSLAYSFAFQTYVLPCMSGPVPGGVRLAAGQSACLAGAQVSGPVTVKSGGSLLASNSVISGPVRSSGADSVRLCASQVTGPVNVNGSSGPVTIGDGSACAANTIDGPVTLSDDTGGVSLVGNTIDGPVTLNGDDGGETVGGNSIAGPLRCMGNLTTPGNGGQPNGVRGPESGDCIGL